MTEAASINLIPLRQFNLKGCEGASVSIHNMLIRENNLSTLTPDYQCQSKNYKVEFRSKTNQINAQYAQFIMLSVIVPCIIITMRADRGVIMSQI